MERVKLLELGMEGTNFDFEIAAGTQVTHLNQALALYILETSKYRGIKPATALAEIQAWVQQLEDNL
jgi:hypothetical protein